MIDYKEAAIIIQRAVESVSTETIPYSIALHRIIAQDIVSDVNMPPFDKSAVDGYACRRSDLGNKLMLKDVIRAGQEHHIVIDKNECAKIMTGAMIPAGADCVFMVEQSEISEDKMIRFIGIKTSDNIARFGEDVKTGSVVLRKGTFIEPKHISVLAATGTTMIEVFRKIKVAIITTGDEIVEPDIKPTGVQIRNCNGPQLVIQLQAINALPSYYGIVTDDFEESKSVFRDALSQNDVLLITGGVSMGDFDFVKNVLQDMQAEILIEKIAIKPGKPTVFAKLGKKTVFGLPGNPVSAFVIFDLFAKPYLLRCMGYASEPLTLKLNFTEDMHFRVSDRTSFVPVRITNNSEIELIDYHGSAHINALSEANGLAIIESGTGFLSKGEKIDVRLF